MVSIRSQLQRIISCSAVTLAIVCLPLTATGVVSADDAPCVPPPDPGPGVHHPVGADAALFTYNCGSGLWVSPHYTYNPSTGQQTPNDPAVYTYNPATGNYDTSVWVYSAPSGSYVQRTQSVVTPPAGATVIGAPTPANDPSITNTGPGSNNTINNDGGAAGGSSINNTGPGSNNQIDGTATSNTTLNNVLNVGVGNNLNALASSGNALVVGNTTGGNATSGDTQNMANVVNMLQSASNALGGDAITFVANIDGDVNGDLLLDPSQLGAVQPATLNTVGTNNTTLNNQVNAGITNNIDLTAQSGNATVSNNTSGGDATSGSAKTIANVVNLINSAVTSGKSFMGVININGNLNGDILLPPDFIDQLVAANVPTVNIVANTGPDSNNVITNNTGSNNTTVNNTNNLGINNNVNASATSGNANVSNNTTGGNATSGSAKTNITAFNLTGSNLIGSNDMLVFVNVLGTWVGLIVNAPPGATAAELGSGITGNGPANNNTTVNNTVNGTISNNIHTTAASGDASVTGNTKGGNATSGNAQNAVNLLNVENSSLSLSGWFGILFINVFGNWNGSFGINTSAGDQAAAAGGGAPSSFAPFASFVPNAGKTASTGGGGSGSFFAFIPGNNSTSTSSISNTGPGSNNVILAASTGRHGGTGAPGLANAPRANIGKDAAIVGAFVAFYIGLDAFYSYRRSHKTAVTQPAA